MYLLCFRYCFHSQGSDYDKFVKVAQKNEDATFLQTKDKTVAKEAGLKDLGIAVITNFEGEQGDARESCVLASCCMSLLRKYACCPSCWGILCKSIISAATKYAILLSFFI